MSGNSCWSPLQTAPIVSDLACLGAWFGGSLAPRAASSVIATSAREVGELVLADLQLIAVVELVRLDSPPVDVGPVQRAGIIQEPLTGASHQHRVIARDGHVVEEDLGVGGAADRQPLALERERLTDPAAAGTDHECASRGRDVADVHRLQLAGVLVDHVRRGRRVVARLFTHADVRAAALAVVGPLRDDEPALRAVTGQGPDPQTSLDGVVAGARGATGENVGQALDVGTGDDFLAAFMLLAEAIDQLSTQDVDLAVEDPPTVGHLLLLVSELLDEVLELLVGERTEIGEGVHL